MSKKHEKILNKTVTILEILVRISFIAVLLMFIFYRPGGTSVSNKTLYEKQSRALQDQNEALREQQEMIHKYMHKRDIHDSVTDMKSSYLLAGDSAIISEIIKNRNEILKMNIGAKNNR